MEALKWEAQKVHGRDEVLRDIENRANAYSDRVVQDVRAVMHDYESVRVAVGKESVELPQTRVTGDIIDFTLKFLKDSAKSEYEGPTTFVSAHAGHYLRRLKDIGIFPDNEEKAKARIKAAGLSGLFSQQVTSASA